MKSLTISIAIALSLMGCGFTSEDSVILIRSNDPTVLLAAEKAKEEWDTCEKTRIFLTQDSSWQGAIPLDVLSSPMFIDGHEASGLTHFNFEDKPDWIHISSLLPTEFYQANIAHEFGHVLTGKLHHGTGLMFGGIQTDPNVHVSPFECSLIKE